MVALVEAAKGLLVLLAGFGLLALIHRDVQAVAERLVWHSHLNPAGKYPRIFLDAAQKMTDARLWLFASFAARRGCSWGLGSTTTRHGGQSYGRSVTRTYSASWSWGAGAAGAS